MGAKMVKVEVRTLRNLKTMNQAAGRQWRTNANNQGAINVNQKHICSGKVGYEL